MKSKTGKTNIRPWGLFHLSILLVFIVGCAGIEFSAERVRTKQIAGNIYAGILAADMAETKKDVQAAAFEVFGELRKHLETVREGKITIDAIFQAVRMLNPRLDPQALELCQAVVEANIGDIQVSISKDAQQFLQVFVEIVEMVHNKLSVSKGTE